MKTILTCFVVLIISLFNPFLSLAELTKPDDKYNRQEVMIPMRDGVKLFTVIYTPKDQKEKLPFLMLRTPYGVKRYPSPEKQGYIRDMAEEEYIFVFQDIRGRYLSEGTFKMQRFSRDKKDPRQLMKAAILMIPSTGCLKISPKITVRPACTAYHTTAGQPLLLPQIRIQPWLPFRSKRRPRTCL